MNFALLTSLALAVCAVSPASGLQSTHSIEQKTLEANGSLEVEFEEIMRSGKLPAELTARTPPERLRALIALVDRRTFLEPQSERGFTHGWSGLKQLIKLHGPLPAGAPAGLLRATLTAWETADNPDREGLVRGLCLMAIAADGPSQIANRLGELPAPIADLYAFGLAEAIASAFASQTGLLPPQEIAQSIAAWKSAELITAVEALAAWGVERPDDATRPDDLPRSSRNGPRGVIGQLAVMATFGESQPTLRLAAAQSMLKICEALDRAGARLGVDRPSAIFGLLPSMTALAALAGAPAEPFRAEQLVFMTKGVKQLIKVDDASIQANTVAAMIAIIDAATFNVCMMASNEDILGAPPMHSESLPLAEALGELIDRLSSLPSDHAAWTAANRCAWVAACERHGTKVSQPPCPAIAKAWINAHAAVVVAWRDACKPAADAETDAARIEESRIARIARRAEWEKKLRKETD